MKMTGHTNDLHSVTFSPDGSRVMPYGYSEQIKQWNTTDGKLLAENRIDGPSPPPTPEHCRPEFFVVTLCDVNLNLAGGHGSTRGVDRRMPDVF
jgi:WD40 repeat protein